jgi:hypothetical protein
MTRVSIVPGLLINQQGKYIGTGIMTAYIEIKTGFDYRSQVKVGNAILFPYAERTIPLCSTKSIWFILKG